MKNHLTFTILGATVLTVLSINLITSYYLFSSGNKKNGPEYLVTKTDILGKQEASQPDEKPVISLIAVGDISFSRGVQQAINSSTSPNYPFLKVKDYMKAGDIVLGNLETTITEGRDIKDNEMIFRSDPESNKILQYAGFTIVSLANNHIPDFGEKGIKDTISNLNNVGIKHIGAGLNKEEAHEPKYLEIQGVTFGFLAYNDTDVVPDSYEATKDSPGTAIMNIEDLKKGVKRVQKKADVVVVVMHAGHEYVEKPNESQINFARAAIDAGADLVIGHHSHVIQTMEKYKDKFIFYSLGNFIFDQLWSTETRQGLILKLVFKGDELLEILFIPTYSNKLAQPEVVYGKEGDAVIERLNFPLEKRVVHKWNEEINDYEETHMWSLSP